MSEMHPTDLHAWLTYRDELASRVTVPDRVVRSVEALTTERPVRGMRRGRTLLAVAAVAAVLLAGIGLPRTLLRHFASDLQHSAAAKPQGVPDRLPPAGIALVWVPDPSTDERIIALDRTGRPVGWMPLRWPLFDQLPEQSGDGQRLLLTDYSKGGRFEATAQGRRIDLPTNVRFDGPNTSQNFNLFFSDDDRSVCMEDGIEDPQHLVVIDGEGHVVHTVSEAPTNAPDYLAWRVATCSVRNDVAVFIADVGSPVVSGPQAPPPTPTSTTLPNGLRVQSISGPTVTLHRGRPPAVPAGSPHFMVRVVRISTGVELARRIYLNDQVQPVDASDDGSAVLEQVEVQRPLSYSLRDIRTGAVLGTLPNTQRSLLDDHLAIVQGDMVPGAPLAHSVVDMTTGRVLWSDVLSLANRIVYPGYGRLVVAIEPRGAQCPSSERVEIADLVAGTTHVVTIDTCTARSN